MSEYSKFLDYFRSKKPEENAPPDGSGADSPVAAAQGAGVPDTGVPGTNNAGTAIPDLDNVRTVSLAANHAGAGNPDPEYPRTVVLVKNQPGAGTPDADASAAAAPQTFAAPPKQKKRRFIRQVNDQQVVSATPREELAQPETTLEKFTDRLSAPPADEREHTGYTGKLDTTTANAAAEDDGTKTVASSVFEDAQTAQQTLFTARRPEEKTKTITLPEHSGGRPDVADNSPTKTIGTDRGALLVEIAKSNAEEAGEDPDQLILEGFFNQEEQQDEATAQAEQEIQQELSKTRQKRINDFHFWNKAKTEAGSSPDEAFAAGQEKISIPRLLSRFSARFESIDSAFLKFNCDEYQHPNEHRAVFKKLMDIRRNTLIKAIVLALLGLALLIINLCASVSAAKHNGFINIMGGSSSAYITTNLIFLALASFVVFDDIRNGIISLLQGHPKTDASLVFLLTTAFAQLIASYLTEQNIESGYHLLTGGVILLLAPLLLAKMFYYDNTRHCFKSIAAKSEKSYLRTLSDTAALSAVLAESNHEDATVVYAGKTHFIRNFIRRSRSSAAGGQISSRITLISMAASFLIGVVAMIVKGNVLWGFSAMCFSAALSFPLGCVFFTGFMIANENQALSVKSSYVRSYSDARDLATVDNIVLRAEDVFSVEITETVCTKGVSRNQAEFCAAVLTDKTGGLLKKAFRNAEGLKTEKLPEVERLTYEDRLGFSAWINDCRVLLGSNAFLVNHNVRMPDESGVLNFIDSENKPLYLAIEGHFTAMFSTKYTCSSEYVKSLKTLADNGTNILIVSSDPNITDAFAEKLLGLPADSVRVISKTAAVRITALQNTVTDSEDTGIVFTPGCETLCRCAASAVKLDKLKKLSKLICEICCCAGVALAAIFAFLQTVSAVSAWLAVLLQLLGAALCFFLPPLLTASSLPAFGKSKVRPVPVGEAYTPENFAPRPQRITDEEDEEEEDGEAPEEPSSVGDADMKIAPESGEKKRFGFRKRTFNWDEVDDYDYDDDDDFDDDDNFDIPMRRESKFGKALKSRLAKNNGQENPDDQADPDEQPVFTGRPVSNWQPEPDEQPPAERPAPAAAPDDAPYSTEELLKSSFFRDEEDFEPQPQPPRAPAGISRGRAPEPAARIDEHDDTYDDGYDEDYDTDYDDYDDDYDDDFGDGLIGRLHNRGKRGKTSRRQRHNEPVYFARGARQNGPDSFAPAPEEPVPEEDDYYDMPAADRRRHGGRPAANAGLSDTMKGLSAKMTSFAKTISKKEDLDEEDDYLQEEQQTFMTSSSPAVAKANRYDDDGPSVADVRAAFSLPADSPAPPKYELGRNDEYDFLNTKFVPPQVRTGDFYNDAYFSRYDVATPTPASDAVNAAKADANGEAAGEPAFAGIKWPKRPSR